MYKWRDDAGKLGLPIRMKRLEGCVPEPGMTSFVFDYEWIPLYSTIIKKPVCSTQQLTRHESMAHTMLINAIHSPLPACSTVGQILHYLHQCTHLQ